MIDFRTSPDRYRHWRLSVTGERAELVLDVDPEAAVAGDYELKMNSYDLGVDVELHDAVQRLRFEHPQVRAVAIRSARERMFCAGANIRMLAGASHAHKVNFCKFTIETRNEIEDASGHSGQRYLAAVAGTAAGGGYELALACDHILLVDDGSAAVSLPEVPLLGVLPGTGGLTRLVDKRLVRRDRADLFATTEEGIRGERALEWGLVDSLAPASSFEDAVTARLDELAARSDRPPAGEEPGVALTDLRRTIDGDVITYDHVTASIDRVVGLVRVTLGGPTVPAPDTTAEAVAAGDRFWPLALAREVDDLLLHLRTNEPTLGLVLLHAEGEADRVADYDDLLVLHGEHWLLREVRLLWKRVWKRLDVTSRSVFTLVTPGSCFVGFLAEALWAADRAYMVDGELDGDDRPPPTVRLSAMNDGPLPMGNGLSRLEARFWGRPVGLEAARALVAKPLDGRAAAAAGLVTAALDDLDWDDELRLAIEERVAFSPDALTAMEANLRHPGPETLETKIFGRLSAWQNWVFSRPNAVGPDGALRRYGSGIRPDYDRERV